MASTPPPALKRLGQHFLIDPNIVRKIVALAEIDAESTVLEIGPGRGILTEALCKAARRVIAVEVDPRLHAFLTEWAGEWANLELHCADALEFPLDRVPAGTIVVANLPYYISTPLLFRLLEERRRLPRLVLMLQAEVAERLVAGPGSTGYGALSVMAQYAADVTIAFRVSAQCFRPRPDVASAVVLLRTKEPRESPAEEEAFRRLVKAAFAHRRKTLSNSLRDQGYEPGHITSALKRVGIAPSRRAETLSIDQFVQLARAIQTA